MLLYYFAPEISADLGRQISTHSMLVKFLEHNLSGRLSNKGPEKLIQWVEIAHSFLHVFTCYRSTLSFSACLGSSASGRKRSFRNPLLKLEKWPLFYLQPLSTNHES